MTTEEAIKHLREESTLAASGGCPIEAKVWSDIAALLESQRAAVPIAAGGPMEAATNVKALGKNWKDDDWDDFLNAIDRCRGCGGHLEGGGYGWCCYDSPRE